jgi:hypothetical protein
MGSESDLLPLRSGGFDGVGLRGEAGDEAKEKTRLSTESASVLLLLEFGGLEEKVAWEVRSATMQRRLGFALGLHLPLGES